MYEYELDLLASYYPSATDNDLGGRSLEELSSLVSTIDHSSPEEVFKYVSYGVSCLRAFLQLNFVGPAEKDKVDVRPPSDLDDSMALERLALSGDPAYELCNSPSYLYTAKWLFIDIGRSWRDVVPSVSWWTCRTCWVWQELFADRRPELRDIAFQEFKFLDDMLPSSSNIPEDLKACYAVEKSQIYGFYFEPEKAEAALNHALTLTGLDNVRLTGILGKKTKFQLKAVAQLALEDVGSDEMGENMEKIPRAEYPKDCALNDDTLLDTTQFQNSLPRKLFTSIQECVLVAFLDSLRRQRFSGDVLLGEIEKAYLDRLLHHPVTYACKFFCLLRRCQTEMNEPRRIERSLAQVEELVGEFRQHRDSLLVSQRIQRSFTIRVPPIWEVRKIEADLLSKLGCTSEALRVFIDLKLWNEVVECYQRLGMMERAESIIKEQLELKETPHLLCLLGDVRNEEHWYEKAWELSGHRLARAQSSLGMLYFVRKKYNEAAEALETALTIFPLDLKSWYALGYCAMQKKDYQRASEAYRRCVTIDVDSFEAWNNLAACYVYLGDKYRAFQVLNEAIKCNYENWKVWENHIHMGIDTGHFREALTGINRLMDLKGKYDDTTVLEILVRVATQKTEGTEDTQQNVDDADEIDENFISDLCVLFGRLTTSTVNNPALWRLYSDLRRPKKDDSNVDSWERYVSILEKAHQTAVRTTGWEKNEDEVDKVVEYAVRLAEARLKLANVIEDASTTMKERPKQLTASARLMLRGVLANVSSSNCEARDGHICTLRGLLESIESM